MPCDPIIHEEEVLVRLVFSNTQVNKRHLNKPTITEDHLRDQRLYRPSRGNSCFSCYRVICCTLNEIKACLKTNTFESVEHDRIFMGIAILKSKKFLDKGLQIIPKTEFGLDCHVNICFTNYTETKGVSPTADIVELLDDLQEDSKFYFDPDRESAEWKGEQI